ncbi:MAG: branched-chain amino acid ABC transporter permease [Rhodovibrionaceae bacterium]|nr:branched-chain amino acid ABC transporter permease [Rhodovibrionaceae bacterium]
MLVLPNRRMALFLALVVVLLATVPFVAETYYLKLATRMIVLAIFAMSLDLLIGYTGLVSFGHAAFFGLAAYALQVISPQYAAANLLLALPGAIAVSALAALAIGALVVRTRGIYFIMVTLAFAQMAFYLVHDTPWVGGSDGAFIYVKPVLGIAGVTLLDLESRESFYFLCLGALVGSYALLVVLLRSPFGEAIQGIRLNEHRMRALGYNTYLYKLASFTVAGALAGLAGFLFAAIDGFVAPQLLGWHQSGAGIMMVILGGLGTLFGPALGAIVFVGVEEVFKERALVGPLADHWQMLLGVFIVAVVLGLRGGVAGWLVRRMGSGRQGADGGRPGDA